MFLKLQKTIEYLILLLLIVLELITKFLGNCTETASETTKTLEIFDKFRQSHEKGHRNIRMSFLVQDVYR